MAGQKSDAAARMVPPRGLPSPSSLALLAAYGALAAPTLMQIARESWVDEQAQHGPLIVALGIWLLWRRWDEARAARNGAARHTLAAAGGLVGGAGYVLGRMAGQYIIESYALFLMGLSILLARLGPAGMRRIWFPLTFLTFAIPVPFAVGWPVTVALRLWISDSAVKVMRVFGVSAASDGLTMYVSSYRIEIEQACSGMNSLITLSALGFAYVYLRRDAKLAYYALLTPAIVLLAVVANFVRVLVIVMLTQGFGDAVAQGAAHTVTGLLTFAVALVGIFALDGLVGPSCPRWSRSSSRWSDGVAGAS